MFVSVIVLAFVAYLTDFIQERFYFPKAECPLAVPFPVFLAIRADSILHRITYVALSLLPLTYSFGVRPLKSNIMVLFSMLLIRHVLLKYADIKVVELTNGRGIGELEE